MCVSVHLSQDSLFLIGIHSCSLSWERQRFPCGGWKLATVAALCQNSCPSPRNMLCCAAPSHALSDLQKSPCTTAQSWELWQPGANPQKTSRLFPICDLSVILMSPHFINSSNFYVKNLVYRWRSSSLYTNCNLNSNSRITASLDLIVTEKERITVQLKSFHTHLIYTPFPGVRLAHPLLLRALRWMVSVWWGWECCSESGASGVLFREECDVQVDGVSFLELRNHLEPFS